MNGSIRKAEVAAMSEVPGSKGLFVWHYKAPDRRWEFGMTDGIKAALDAKSIDD